MVVPEDGMVIREDTTLAPGVYFLPGGITIGADGVTLDGNGALIVGSNREGVGVRVEGRRGVTVRNLRLREFYHGIRAERCAALTLAGNQIASTAEVAANTVFLDIWLGPDAAYGGGICLREVVDSTIADNDLQHQQSG